MARPKVIVVGLGAMGSAAAASLAARSADVIGLDRFTAGHDRGSSHGDSRIVRKAYFEHPDYVPLLDRAYDGWARLSRQVGVELVTRTGALMIGAPTSPIVAGTMASVERWGLAHEVLDRLEMGQRFGQFRLGLDEVAVYERDAGFVRPEEVVHAQLRLAAAAGVDLRFGVAVDGWDTSGGRVQVSVDGDTLTADHLVVTAGPWAGQVLAGYELELQPMRTVMYRFEPLAPALFAPAVMPVFVYDLGGHDALYGVGDLVAVDADGNVVHAAKVGFHHRLTPTDPDAVERNVAESEIVAMRAVLTDRLPLLAGRCVAATVCLYTMTPDEHFVIGHLPGTDGQVSVAAGFSGHGFKFAPLVGDVLADLALDGATDAPIDLFDPQRFGRR